MNEDEKDMAKVARKKLESASLKLYDVRLGGDVEPHDRSKLDEARAEVDEVLELLRSLAS